MSNNQCIIRAEHYWLRPLSFARDNDIEIAFPQREIRVRTADEIIPSVDARRGVAKPKVA